METTLFVAKILSALSLLAVAAALVNLWRRGDLPVFSYGGVALTGPRMKALWFAFLVGGLAVGSNNDPVLQTTSEKIDVQAAASAGRSVGYALTLPFPFYRYERSGRRVDGVVVEERILEGLVLPWSLLWALLAYFFLVVRWNPESRWARRILEGRKRSRGAAPDAPAA